MLDYITKYWKQNVKKEKKVKENEGECERERETEERKEIGWKGIISSTTIIKTLQKQLAVIRVKTSLEIVIKEKQRKYTERKENLRKQRERRYEFGVLLKLRSTFATQSAYICTNIYNFSF